MSPRYSPHDVSREHSESQRAEESDRAGRDRDGLFFEDDRERKSRDRDKVTDRVNGERRASVVAPALRPIISPPRPMRRSFHDHAAREKATT